jgi:hypothetical protein
LKRTQRGSGEVLFSIVAAAIVAVLSYWVVSVSCSSRWAGSGLQSSYGLAQGCLVKTPSGRWIPDDRVRDTDLAAPASPSAPIP